VQADLEALKWLNKSLALNPRLHFTRLYQASARALCDQEAQAETEWAELLRLHPDWTVSRLEALEPSQVPAFRAQQKRIYEGLRRAGLRQ
jgi:adenylate cyclase